MIDGVEDISESERLEVLPDDVLTVLAKTLLAKPRRPAALLALTSTCSQLRALLPPDVQKQSSKDCVAHSLAHRLSTSDLQRMGIIKGAPGTSARKRGKKKSPRRRSAFG